MARSNVVPRNLSSTALRVAIKAAHPAGASLRQDSGVFALSEVPRAHSPFSWAVVPQTLAEDGAALDAFVIDAGQALPGDAVDGEIVGGLMVRLVDRDQHRPDRAERLLILLSVARDPDALSARVRQQVQRLVVAAGESAGKRVLLEGWEDAAYARDAVLRARAAFRNQLS